MAVPDRTRTRLRQALTAQIDRSDAMEVTVEAGDCILLDPMCASQSRRPTLPTSPPVSPLHSSPNWRWGAGLHSASDVATRSRYALFTSFFHEAAIGLYPIAALEKQPWKSLKIWYKVVELDYEVTIRYNPRRRSALRSPPSRLGSRSAPARNFRPIFATRCLRSSAGC